MKAHLVLSWVPPWNYPAQRAAKSRVEARDGVRHSDFYVTAATVVPVIYFFLLLEVRWFTSPQLPPGRSPRATRGWTFFEWFTRLVVSFLVIQIGYVEYAFFAALETQHDNPTTRNLAMVNIATLSLAMVLASLPYVWRKSHRWQWDLDTQSDG